MPNIPLYDSEPVQTRDYSNPGPVFDDNSAGRKISEGMENLGRGLGNLADSAVAMGKHEAAVAKEAKEKAYAINHANSDAEYQRGETAALVGGSNRRKLIDDAFEGTGPAETLTSNNVKSAPGFYGTRGLEAGEKSADTLDKLEQLRQNIAKKNFADEAERQKWLARSGGMFEDTRRKVETHSARQFEVAQSDALKGKLSSTLDKVANDPYVDTREEALSGDEAILKLQISKEGGQAAVEQWHSQLAKTRITSLLSAGDVAGAEAQFNSDRQSLGTDAPLVKAEIARARAAAAHAAAQGQADLAGEHAAQLVFQGAVNPKTGWVDAAKATAEIDKLPAETPEQLKIKEEARDRLARRLQVAKAQKAEAVETTFDRGLQAYRASGSLSAVAPADKVWLQNKDNDPNAWERLRAIAKADAEHAQGAPETPEQQAAMTSFLVDLNDHPEKYATMTTEGFNSEWLAKLSKKDGDRAGAVMAAMHGRKGDLATKPEELAPIENGLLLQAGRDAGLFDPKSNDVSKWDADQAALYYRAQQDLSRQLADYRRSHGKPPDLDTVKGWANEKLLKGKNPDKTVFGFGGNTTRLEAEVKGTPFVPAWDDAEKEKARAALRANGLPADDKTVDTLLRRKHKLPALPTQAAPASAEEEPEVVPLTRPPKAVDGGAERSSKGAF